MNLLVVITIKWLWKHMIGTNNIVFLVLLHHLSGNLSGLGILPVINKTIDFQSG